jgi:hypothetical protein
VTRRCRIGGTLALALLAACSGGGGTETIGRDGSVRVDTPEAVAIGEPPDTYAITYRVEELVGDRVRTSTATLTVDRPFRSRLETRDGGTVVSLRVADFGYSGAKSERASALVVTAAPAAASGDVRTELLVEGAGREVRRVAGAVCQVHRFGAPLLAGEVAPGDDVDECIDGDGLILEEIVRSSGVITRRWVAASIGHSPRVDDADFRLSDVKPLPTAEGGGSVQAVDPTSAPPGTFWQLDEPPPGFTRRGRYAVVPPQSARADDPETRSQVVAGVVDVFTRGPDVLLIDQGGTLGQVPPFGTQPGSDLVDLGALAKTGEWFPTPTGAEVRALIPPGRYVKVSGSLPADDLIAIARSLRPIEGTGLTYVK